LPPRTVECYSVMWKQPKLVSELMQCHLSSTE
jgi:hypothetical protein